MRSISEVLARWSSFEANSFANIIIGDRQTSAQIPRHPLARTSPHHKAINMAANALGRVYTWAIPTAIAFSFASAALYDVKGGTRAVIFDRLRGVSDQVSNEGTHFLIPWLQRAIIYDVRTKPRNISTTTGSKDLQMVSLTLRVLHRPEVGQLPKIYQVCHAESCYPCVSDLPLILRVEPRTRL